MSNNPLNGTLHREGSQVHIVQGNGDLRFAFDGGRLTDEQLQYIVDSVNKRAFVLPEQTGEKAASVAGRVLNNPESSSEARTVAGSALSQAPSRVKKPRAKAGKKGRTRK